MTAVALFQFKDQNTQSDCVSFGYVAVYCVLLTLQIVGSAISLAKHTPQVSPA